MKFHVYLDDLITPDQLVDVFAWAAVEEDAGQVDGAFPGLKAAFVNASANVGVFDVVESFVVGCFVFGHQLNADV